MVKNRLPRSVRKFIREEKARIRRSVANPAEHERLIQEMLQRFVHYGTKEKSGA